MERGQPHPPEGGEHHNETPETPTEPIFEQLSDEQRIQRGIADALNEERPIDDATVRRIAEQLHGGHESLLSALAASGALPDGLERELLEAVQDLPPERDSWIDALLDYVDACGEDRGPREDWAEATGDEATPVAPSAEEQAREAAARPRDRDQERFNWFGGAAAGEDEPDALIANTPIPEHETTPRPAPRIYVADLAAYNNSRLHGVWLDATREVEDLWADVQAMLASSPIPGAEEIAIHDHEDFAGYPLGEHESLEFVVRLARGIAEHGQAFAAYADWNRQGDPVVPPSEHNGGAQLPHHAPALISLAYHHRIDPCCYGASTTIVVHFDIKFHPKSVSDISIKWFQLPQTCNRGGSILAIDPNSKLHRLVNFTLVCESDLGSEHTKLAI